MGKSGKNYNGKNGGIGAFFKWFGRNRRIQVIFIVFTLFLPVFLIVYGIIVPVRNEKPNPAGTLSGTLQNDTLKGSIANLSEQQADQVRKIIEKEKDYAYQKTRLALAQKDSIYMVLNVPESLLLLEIKGVAVKKVRLEELKVSNRFTLISHENLLPWISQPFSLERDQSTIPKSPIVVKQAPKDTLEAARMSTKPAPPDSTNVYFTLYFDRNLVLEVEQTNPAENGATEVVEAYRKNKRKESNRSVINRLFNPKQADQPMMISMKISEAEARAIYRAMPVKSHLILKL